MTQPTLLDHAWKAVFELEQLENEINASLSTIPPAFRPKVEDFSRPLIRWARAVTRVATQAAQEIPA